MKRKNYFTITLIIIMLISLCGCTQSTNAPAAPSDSPEADVTVGDQPAPVQDEGKTPAPAAKNLPKVGIITGPSDQFKEEYAAALKIKEKYGDMIVISLYPDILNPKVDALALNMKSLADDGAGAIVISPGVPGTTEAMARVRQSYPDMLFICGSASEKPEQIAANADVVLNLDTPGIGPAIIRQARRMGAKVFVHYTFARHMGESELSERRDLMMQTCEEEGIQFVDATIPDPKEVEYEEVLSFVASDVTKMVVSYGKDTAFYTTEEAIQETLMKSVLWEGALFPAQCQLSPINPYSAAFGVDIPLDKANDMPYALDLIRQEVVAKGGEGRFSALPAALGPIIIEVGAEYAVKLIGEAFLSRNDLTVIEKLFSDVSNGGDMVFRNIDAESGITLQNYYFVLPEFVNLW